MLNVEQAVSKSRHELMMEVASVLGALTQKTEDFRFIARYLSAAFHLPTVTLAVVKSVPDGALILLSGTSAAAPSPTLEQDLLDIHHNTRPLTAHDGPVIRPAPEMQGEASAPAARDTIFAQAIDEQDRLLLIVHHSELTAEQTAILQLIANHLGKNLQTLLSWIHHPKVLGQPFDRLTDREWMVLRGLNSDAGEKQLADQLGLSPHTLHSHIKAIYRKVGVQGRLSLLRRLEEALREYQLSKVAAQPLELPWASSGSAVAFA